MKKQIVEVNDDTLVLSVVKIEDDAQYMLEEAGESVTWEAVHFGIKQKLTAKITDRKTLPIY